MATVVLVGAIGLVCGAATGTASEIMTRAFVSVPNEIKIVGWTAGIVCFVSANFFVGYLNRNSCKNNS